MPHRKNIPRKPERNRAPKDWGMNKVTSIAIFFLMIRRPPRSTLFPYNDALPIYIRGRRSASREAPACRRPAGNWKRPADSKSRSEEHTSELQSHDNLVCRLL